ncbi:hypothetical protein B0T19DRAFT_435326 [Cercophora scortea]|uniref:SET domain-containing protein n=1 Tax=Cercophora scortea TaxID=314031 RepID=A0AAE0I399_9PEZI|nr:hypothetical protein B0T19DRAFT_435326 [Cercophora scortea]
MSEPTSLKPTNSFRARLQDGQTTSIETCQQISEYVVLGANNSKHISTGTSLSPGAYEYLKIKWSTRNGPYPDNFACLHCGKKPTPRARCDAETCYYPWKRANLDPIFHVGNTNPENDAIEIRETGTQGWGVFATRDIPAGTWLGQYLGEVREGDELNDAANNYIYELDNFDGNGRPVSDAQSFGNWTRFVNSHCDPNCEHLGAQAGRVRMVLFRTVRDVQRDEELFINYGDGFFDDEKNPCGCSVCVARRSERVISPERVQEVVQQPEQVISPEQPEVIQQTEQDN